MRGIAPRDVTYRVTLSGGVQAVDQLEVAHGFLRGEEGRAFFQDRGGEVLELQLVAVAFGHGDFLPLFAGGEDHRAGIAEVGEGHFERAFRADVLTLPFS